MRGGQQDLVTRIDQSGERLEYGLLGAIGDHHTQALRGDTRVGRRVAGDGISKWRQAQVRRVVVVARIIGGASCRGHDVRRGGKVGLAGAEGDDIAALGRQLTGPRVYGKSC